MPISWIFFLYNANIFIYIPYSLNMQMPFGVKALCLNKILMIKKMH